MPSSEQNLRLQKLAQGQYRLIYIAPERLRNVSFLSALKMQTVSLLAVDEAHCISEWGHDFRPDYLHIAQARASLGNPLTAALGDGGSLAILAVNRSLQDDIALTCDLRAFQNLKFKEHIVLHHNNPKAVNSEEAPNTVVPVVRQDCELEDEYFKINIPALSWNVIKFTM